MLHHWQPTGAKGFQCGGEWFPGYMFEAKPMVIEHQWGQDGRDLPWVAIAHRHCFTPADFLGVRMQNMLPTYQLARPASPIHHPPLTPSPSPPSHTTHHATHHAPRATVNTTATPWPMRRV